MKKIILLVVPVLMAFQAQASQKCESKNLKPDDSLVLRAALYNTVVGMSDPKCCPIEPSQCARNLIGSAEQITLTKCEDNHISYVNFQFYMDECWVEFDDLTSKPLATLCSSWNRPNHCALP